MLAVHYNHSGTLDCPYGKERFDMYIGRCSIFILLAVAVSVSVLSIGVSAQAQGGEEFDGSRLRPVYLETFDASKHPDQILWGVLDYNSSPDQRGWIAKLVNGAYMLENSEHPGEILYFYGSARVEEADKTLSEYVVTADIDARVPGDARPAGAGLLFGYVEGQYLGFVVGPGRSYFLLRKDQTGVNVLAEGSGDMVNESGKNRLTIAQDQGKIYFMVNGARVFTMEVGGTITGGAGIIAISPGTFLFDDFTLSTAGVDGGQQGMAPAPPLPVRNNPAGTGGSPAPPYPPAN